MESIAFSDPSDAPPAAVQRHSGPLTHHDLHSRGASILATPRPQPLAPWSRLWPVLRAALQASRHGRDPDVPALLRAWARGETLSRIPRVRRHVWSERASVWIDRSSRLVPFWSDQIDVCRRLRAVCGPGIEVRLLGPREQAWAVAGCGDFLSGFHLDPETPVLVLGDLGTYASPAERAAWLRTARRLRCAHVPVAAVVPAPPARWVPDVARAWSAAPWERGRTPVAALAARVSCAPLPPVEASAPLSARAPGPAPWQERAGRLLRLASPAAFLQPGLLRSLRLLLPAAEADAGTEADAWCHADVRAADATGLVLHPAAADRLRREFPDEVAPGLHARVSEAISRWHADMPNELRHVETITWLALALPGGAMPPGDAEEARQFARRLEVSARAGAGDPQPPAAMLRRYARTMLRSMPHAAYQEFPALKMVWAVAFADVSEVDEPEGLNADELYADLASAGEPRWWAVRQVGGDLVFSCSERQAVWSDSDADDVWSDSGVWGEPGSAWPSHERRGGSPVAWLRAGDQVFVQRAGQGLKTKLVLKEGLCLPLHPGEGLVLRGHRCTVTLACWAREPWAVAAGRDRFGLWADAEVKGVVVRFRWIPPGRFRMGSPEKEAGRFDDEGPQHEVTWTTGRWLADTPVTQALWQAVMGKNPSRFVSPERPVEQVSWDDCELFLGKLNELVPGLEARMPSEAEWEHACRAGTETATWLGDLEILSANNAPLLDPIAWYGGNCGVDFELDNGFDITSFDAKQHEHAEGGTHPVKRKDPNPFGLFDMLGNVYEWCLDATDRGTGYAAKEPVTDPSPTTTGSRRVIRGGSWFSDAGYVRAARRFADAPDNRDDYLGFRLARGQGPVQGAEPAAPSGSSALDAERPMNRGAGRGPVRAPARDVQAAPGSARKKPKKSR